MFKKGDFIKIKSNRVLESGEEISEWAGIIQEVYLKEKCCLINFDAQTIESLSDSFLIDGLNIGAEPFEYIFTFNDLEISERRDTDRQLEKALNNLASRMIDLEKSMGEYNRSQQEKWIKEFQKTELFNVQNKAQQENSKFIITVFMDLMYNYGGVMPGQWTPSDVEEICLHVVPRKIVADEETFEMYGDVLIQFFKFLEVQRYIDNAKSIINKIQKIKGKIFENSKNPDNYGMGKSLIHGKAGGLPLDSSGAVDIDALKEHLDTLSIDDKVHEVKLRPIRPNPFKDIGRNEKITVKYADGRIIENIKFKKVEMDLKSGECELIK